MQISFAYYKIVFSLLLLVKHILMLIHYENINACSARSNSASLNAIKYLNLNAPTTILQTINNHKMSNFIVNVFHMEVFLFLKVKKEYFFSNLYKATFSLE